MGHSVSDQPVLKTRPSQKILKKLPDVKQCMPNANYNFYNSILNSFWEIKILRGGGYFTITAFAKVVLHAHHVWLPISQPFIIRFISNLVGIFSCMVFARNCNKIKNSQYISLVIWGQKWHLVMSQWRPQRYLHRVKYKLQSIQFNLNISCYSVH